MKAKGKTVGKELGEPEPHDLGWAGGSFFTLSAGRETEQENLLSHQLYTPYYVILRRISLSVLISRFGSYFDFARGYEYCE